jgi:hypothetical protein
MSMVDSLASLLRSHTKRASVTHEKRYLDSIVKVSAQPVRDGRKKRRT